jgi:hypothetical protein
MKAASEQRLRKTPMQRRRFIKAMTLASLALGRPAFAFGRASQLTFALLDAGDAAARQKAWARLGLEIESRTSIKVSSDALIIDPDAAELFDYPLLICVGQGEAPDWPEQRWKRLAHYVRSGGMIYFDALVPGDQFGERCVERLARQLPSDAATQTTKEHVLFRSFYLLKNAVGRGIAENQTQILELDGRIVALGANVDLGGAVLRDEFGAWAFSCDPGGEDQREHAVRFGVNVVMYALCTDYKADQVHIPFLLKRRQ